MPNGKCVEIYTPNDILLFRVFFTDTPNGNQIDGKKQPSPQTGQKPSEPMSDAQKRYLFRIMAHDGFEGDAAHDALKELFKVSHLTEVSKYDASKMIEQLLDRQNGGG